MLSKNIHRREELRERRTVREIIGETLVYGNREERAKEKRKEKKEQKEKQKGKSSTVQIAYTYVRKGTNLCSQSLFLETNVSRA